ncbi:hypothetical protein SAMN05421788_1124 [Filimonas lacunae]|uniref:Uncharacterized protein n=1 Tax=Filimonas lacunae TaxID=477680 RepID=A0A1N7RD30_9BACT|nr:hypothetical protein SAMN05421788_1124 [Filimonas lacunae]
MSELWTHLQGGQNFAANILEFTDIEIRGA